MRETALASIVLGLALCLHAGGCGGGGGAAVTLIELRPASGFTPGGTVLTLRGSGFGAPGSIGTVTVGGTPASDVVVSSDTSLTCTAPPGVAGNVDVSVAISGGGADLPGAFTYFGYPPSFLASDVRLDTDAPGAAHSQDMHLDGSGSWVYAAWIDDRNGGEDIYLNGSADGGATWHPADVRLNTDPAGASTSRGPHVCSQGADVYVVWRDHRSGGSDVYFNRSQDGGKTWLGSDVRLCTDPPGSAPSFDTRICCAGPNLYVAWSDIRNGTPDVFFNRSTDGGSTWLATDVRITSYATSSASSSDPQLCCDGSNVYVVWSDGRNGNYDVYFNRSTDGGTTWLPADVRLDTNAAGADDSEHPQICCDGSRVHVVWYDKRNGNYDVYSNRSTDGGTTWLATDVRLDTDAPGVAASDEPQVCCDGANVHVVWVDDRDGAKDVRYTQSSDGGATWLAADLRLDTDAPGAAASEAPRICCDGPVVCAAWDDVRDGLRDVYVNCSIDGGATWLAADRRMNTDGAGTASAQRPELCCAGARVYVAWEDDRATKTDVRFNTTQP